MPQFEWKDEDMRYASAFPWVGAVIGVLWYLWKWICVRFGVGNLVGYTVVGTAIPILDHRGLYVDGFLDTCDALHSYQPRERKLEILKDFSYRGLCGDHAGSVWTDFLGGFSEITECRTLVVAGAGSFPVQSAERCCSGEFPFRKAGGDAVSVRG